MTAFLGFLVGGGEIGKKNAFRVKLQVKDLQMGGFCSVRQDSYGDGKGM